MCTVLLPPGVNPTAFDKYIISYRIVSYQNFPLGLVPPCVMYLSCAQHLYRLESTVTCLQAWRNAGGQTQGAFNTSP